MLAYKPTEEDDEQKSVKILCCKGTKDNESSGWKRTKSAKNGSKQVVFRVFWMFLEAFRSCSRVAGGAPASGLGRLQRGLEPGSASALSETHFDLVKQLTQDEHILDPARKQ